MNILEHVIFEHAQFVIQDSHLESVREDQKEFQCKYSPLKHDDCDHLLSAILTGVIWGQFVRQCRPSLTLDRQPPSQGP